MTPNYITNTLNPVCDNTNYALRSIINFNMRLQKPRTNALKKTISYAGSETWNQLSCSLKEIENMCVFKDKRHSYFMKLP